ncbi:MAG: TldD/PmbA family protein [Deltaproteobacteria bacterium]|nr:TldD/PmbA family protein [Deltaproteobacteria bacterium]
MEQLLERASKAGDQVEIYFLEQASDRIQFENGRLKDMESKMQSGFSLRIIKDGCLGFAYTKNLLDRDEFLKRALDSLEGKMEAPFSFPAGRALPPLNTCDPILESLPNTALVEEGNRVCSILRTKAKGEINVSIQRSLATLRLLNSRGSDYSLRSSSYYLNPSLLFPGSQAGLDRPFLSKGFEPYPTEKLDFLQTLFNQAQKEVRPQPGKMKTLFFPEALYGLIWRIQAGANGKNIYEKTSPLLNKTGAQLFDSQITLYDDPLNDQQPQARSFDDEGVPCRKFIMIEQGVIQNPFYDLFYAGKMKTSPTGHGFKSAMWGGETVALKPRPALEYLYLKPGEKTFWDLVQSMDRGILVAGVLGAHSGNILNGDFSLGLAPALYVENGWIIGRVKDAMAAGNIYETLKEVLALEDKIHASYGGTFPAVLLDQVSVAF